MDDYLEKLDYKLRLVSQAVYTKQNLGSIVNDFGEVEEEDPKTNFANFLHSAYLR